MTSYSPETATMRICSKSSFLKKSWPSLIERQGGLRRRACPKSDGRLQSWTSHAKAFPVFLLFDAEEMARHVRVSPLRGGV